MQEVSDYHGRHCQSGCRPSTCVHLCDSSKRRGSQRLPSMMGSLGLQVWRARATTSATHTRFWDIYIYIYMRFKTSVLDPGLVQHWVRSVRGLERWALAIVQGIGS